MATSRRRTRAEDVDGDIEQPQAKRPRLSAVNGTTTTVAVRGEYRHGSVVRIEMHNFVTYNSCVVYPGARLNVVIGPNGTGKSTLVCALALGLGGPTSILGRAKDVADFIRHGAESAMVIIELFNSKNKAKNYVVSREIHRDNSSKWKLNGATVTKKEIANLMTDLNIQVENLCQFLPQDKVASFAAMNSTTLLRETERAVGGQEMVDMHDQLVELKKEETSLSQQLEQRNQVLEGLRKANQALERDVLRFKEREKCLEEVKLLEMKRLWLLWDESRQRYDELKKSLAKSQNDLERLENQQKPLKDQIDELDQILQQCEDEMNKQREIMKKIDQNRRSKMEVLEKHMEELDAVKEEYGGLNRRAEDRKKEAERIQGGIRQLKTDIIDVYKKIQKISSAGGDENEDRANNNRRKSTLKLDVSNIDVDDADDFNRVVNALHADLDAKLAECNNRSARLRKDYENVDESQRDWRIKDRESEGIITQTKNQLKQIDDARSQRIESLRMKDAAAHTAWTWIQKNTHMFQKRVYGPVALELNVKNPLHGDYLEHIIPGYIMYSFIVQTHEDRETMLRELYERQGLSIKVNYADPSKLPEIRRPHPIEDLKPFGVTHYMDQTFECDEHLKHVLCSLADLHRAAAGSQQTSNKVEEFFNKTNIRVLFTPDSSYFKNTSLYSQKSSTSVKPLKRSRLFSGVDLERRKQLLKTIEEHEQRRAECRTEIEILASQEKTMQEQQNNLKRERESLLTEKKRIDSVVRKIQLYSDQLKNVNAEENLERETAKLKAKEKDINTRREKLVQSLVQMMKGLGEAARACDLWFLRRTVARTKRDARANQLKDSSQAMKDLTRRVQEDAIAATEAKNEAVRLKEEAQRAAPLTADRKAAFEALPKTKGEIDDQIARLKVKADLNWAANPKVIEDYEARRAEIQRLEAELNDEQQGVESKKRTIARILGQWKPKLEDIVQGLNVNFSKSFVEIGCAGEVKLNIDESDYTKAGIEIWVKFRAVDPLRQLDAHVQSGGERSVCTMLYLIALQHLTSSPFRLVDEINQGMDPYNERMVFERLVQTANKPNLPQYFLITPKLLTDLTYTKDMTVLTIFNGPWFFDRWDLSYLE
jgi:chromosome segregation ATPase